MSTGFAPDDIVIVEAARSIVGSTNGSLKALTAAALAVPVVNGMLGRLSGRAPPFSRGEIDALVVGLCLGAGIGQNLPRQIAHATGMDEIPSALAVNEMCGSGLEAILLGAQALRLGEATLALVGGVEAPSSSPWLVTDQQLIAWQERTFAEVAGEMVRSDLHDALWDRIFNVHTIHHAETTTADWVARQGRDPDAFKREIDEYAKLSHDRALAATASGAFREEIIVIPGTGEKDELPARKNLAIMYQRRGTQFTPQGRFLSHHNSPPLANAAAFLLLATQRTAERLGLPVLARLAGHGRAGTTPERFLLAPIRAVRRLLERTRTTIADYDLVESNTAFGSQMLINLAELGLNLEKTNIHGDCLGLGHPIGAAGARITTTLLYALKHRDRKRGMALICLGGGNGLALALERP